LFDLPTDEAAMLRHYTLADDDLEIIAPVAVPTIASALPCNFAHCDIPVGCWRRARSFRWQSPAFWPRSLGLKPDDLAGICNPRGNPP
jgi:hypothetical protein